MIVALRAFDPRRSWALVDPIDIGLVPGAATLARERLCEALADAAAVSGADLSPARHASEPAARPASGAPQRSQAGRPARELNPDVRALRDLRAGMMLRGRVVRVERLGALIDVGLPVEGLLIPHAPTSGSSDSAARAVRRGQEVEVTVVAVDKPHQKLTLALKSVARGGQGKRRRRTRGGRRRDR